MNLTDYEYTQETKAHGSQSFPFNIYPCSIPLDFSAVPLHWHSDMEIIYIKKGQGQVVVDLTSYPVRAGEIVLVSPGRLHSIAQQNGCAMEYENIIFQLELLLSAAGDLCGEQFFLPLLYGQVSLPVHLTARHSCYHKAARLLDEIDRFSACKEPISALGIKGKLFELFYLLFQNCAPAPLPKRPLKSLETLKTILTHVKNHYQKTLTVADLAQVCGFSCSHFMKFFKKHMGTSFIEYLNDYRLTMAAQMLLASAEPIVVVAGASGFENLSYFNRLFKRKYKMTPSEYRKAGNDSAR